MGFALEKKKKLSAFRHTCSTESQWWCVCCSPVSGELLLFLGVAVRGDNHNVRELLALEDAPQVGQVRAVGEGGGRRFDGDGIMAIALRAAVRGGGWALGGTLTACGRRHG